MMMNDLIDLVNKKLDEYIPVEVPENIFKSMRYTVLLSGKRLRPIMCLEIARLLGASVEDALPMACAVEMLHAQTLIHDDLPCMDNDDYRRGQLTNHKVFGEYMAVLAGDALLTFAPNVVLKYSKNLSSEVLIKLMKEFFNAAGAYGVIAGQVVDLEQERMPKNIAIKTGGDIIPIPGMEDKMIEVSKNLLHYLQLHKTGDLFKLALRSGAIIAGASETILNELSEFGEKLGIAFQIADDILDETSTFEEMGKTLGKDKVAGKLTYVSLYGIEKARVDKDNLIDECFGILERNNLKSEVFESILNRIKSC